MRNVQKIFAGEILQILSVGALTFALVLSLHHWPIMLSLIGGFVGFLTGRRLRGV